MAPYLNMILKADINRIYDEKYLEAEQAKKESFFARPKKSENGSTGRKRRKKPGWITTGMGIDLPFCIIILVLLTIGLIMMFSASYPVAYYNKATAIIFS